MNCQQSFFIIKSHILDFYHKIKGYTPESLSLLSPEELYLLYQDLDYVSHLEVSDHLAYQILEDPDVRQALPTSRSYYSAFFGHHEIHLAEELLRDEKPWSVLRDFPLCPRYRELIENQIRATSLSPDETLVFVGCGPLPVTLILLSRLYGFRSIGLDTNPQAVSVATKCIGRLGLEREVSIVEGDESALRDLEWDSVLVAALAEPKPRIFRTLLSILKDKGPLPVCYRTYSGMRAVLRHPVQPEDIKGFRKVREIIPAGQVNNTLVVLEPEEDG